MSRPTILSIFGIVLKAVSSLDNLSISSSVRLPVLERFTKTSYPSRGICPEINLSNILMSVAERFDSIPSTIALAASALNPLVVSCSVNAALAPVKYCWYWAASGDVIILSFGLAPCNSTAASSPGVIFSVLASSVAAVWYFVTISSTVPYPKAFALASCTNLDLPSESPVIFSDWPRYSLRVIDPSWYARFNSCLASASFVRAAIFLALISSIEKSLTNFDWPPLKNWTNFCGGFSLSKADWASLVIFSPSTFGLISATISIMLSVILSPLGPISEDSSPESLIPRFWSPISFPTSKAIALASSGLITPAIIEEVSWFLNAKVTSSPDFLTSSKSFISCFAESLFINSPEEATASWLISCPPVFSADFLLAAVAKVSLPNALAIACVVFADPYIASDNSAPDFSALTKLLFNLYKVNPTAAKATPAPDKGAANFKMFGLSLDKWGNNCVNPSPTFPVESTAFKLTFWNFIKTACTDFWAARKATLLAAICPNIPISGAIAIGSIEAPSPAAIGAIPETIPPIPKCWTDPPEFIANLGGASLEPL